jgi:cytoplasmic polyadenylation element-binding protein
MKDEIVCQFRQFGHLIVDWPHKNEANSSFPPKGYAFLIFENEPSVHELISFCSLDKEKFYLSISSSSMKDKPVFISFV